MRALRPHQDKSIALLRQSLARGNRTPLLQVPTGGGKTVIAANIINMARAKGNRVAFCVPAISLVDQTVEEFIKEGITDIGVIQANHPMRDLLKPVQVCSIQSLRKGVIDTDMVIVDEAHRMFDTIGTWIRRTKKPFIGLSATPWARGLGKWYDDLIVGATMAELIEQGYLSDYRVYAPSHPDLSGVRKTAGDYNQHELSEVMGERRLVADVVDTWLKLGEGRPTLCFAVDRAHAQKLQRQFEQAGIGAGYVDAFTDLIERRHVQGQLARGEIQVVCNVGCLTTGVDWDIRCIILARPTRSEMLFVQMVGRGLRTAQGKADCVILDHADNHARMGFVSDIHYGKLDDGSAEGRQTPERKEALPKDCPKCSFVKAPKVRECPKCGFVPEVRSEIENEDGDLIEVRRGKQKVTAEDKQLFWSMANFVDRERGKGGKLAKALYRSKFGVWPKGLRDIPTPPDSQFLSYEKSRRIAFAKMRNNGAKQWRPAV